MSIVQRFAHQRSTTLIYLPVILTSLLLVPEQAPAERLCPLPLLGDDSYGIVSADFNGDGLADVAVSSGPIPIPPVTDVPKISILFGSSVGAPARAAGTILTTDEVRALAVGDMNEDGTLDLLAAGAFGVPYIRLLPGDGTGSFSLGAMFPVSGAGQLAVGDFNGDSHLDVAVTKGNDGLTVLFGDGNGHLGPEQTVSSMQAYDASAGDLNEDGRTDILAFNGNGTPGSLLAFLGNADGTFTALAAQPTGYNLFGVELGDMNEDGHLDVVAGGAPVNVPHVTTYLGRGDGTFVMDSAPAVLGGTAVVGLGDVDGDGHLDALSYRFSVLLVFCDTGTLLYFHHGRGDGTIAAGVGTEWRSNSNHMALGDMNGDGFADAALPSCGAFTVRPGTPNGLGDLVNAGRAFPSKNGEAIKLNSNKPSWCAYIESVDGSFDLGLNYDIPRDITIVSPGTGSIASARSNSKEIIIGDYDQNGIPDMQVCFPKDQLRQLFSSVVVTQTVNVSIEGTISTEGCRFRAPLTITVIPGGVGQAAARMSPNIFATTSVLSFATPRGQVRARIYDVSGRLVKTLMDGAAEAGSQRVRVEARDGNGKPLPSGVYFFRIDSPNGPESGRFVIAR